VGIACQFELNSRPSEPSTERDVFNQIALDMVADAVFIFVGSSMNIVYANRSASRTTGYLPQHLLRMTFFDVAPALKCAGLSDLIYGNSHLEPREVTLCTVYHHKSGELLPIQCSIRSACGSPDGLIVAVARRINATTGTSNQGGEIAMRDSLTGLPNRDWFLRRVESAVQNSQTNNSRFAVLFADVDQFKAVNDTMGHLVGDQVLRAVASQLLECMRPGDAVARFGGDEFVALVRDVNCVKSVKAIARRIGRSVFATRALAIGKKSQVRVTVSMGAALCGGRWTTALHAVDTADRAMYRAKALGRNGRFAIDDLSLPTVNCGEEQVRFVDTTLLSEGD
jgi:diguanylate cyclase (GGDEF)-like protein